jgi:hypothetical protein
MKDQRVFSPIPLLDPPTPRLFSLYLLRITADHSLHLYGYTEGRRAKIRRRSWILSALGVLLESTLALLVQDLKKHKLPFLKEKVKKAATLRSSRPTLFSDFTVNRLRGETACVCVCGTETPEILACCGGTGVCVSCYLLFGCFLQRHIRRRRGEVWSPFVFCVWCQRVRLRFIEVRINGSTG